MITAPAHWAATNFAEITRSIANHRPDDRPEEDFVYIDISSIDDANRITEPKQLSGRDAPSRARQLVEAGDTVLSTVRTYLKNTALVPDSLLGAIASTGFCVLRPAAGVHPQFIFYRALDQTFVDELSGLQTGTSYPAVRDSDIRAMSISLPPTAEQHRIVQALDSYLTRLDAAQAALERVQASLKRYRASVLKAAVEGKLVTTEAELARKEGHDYEPASVLLERILADRRARWESQEKRRGTYKKPASANTSDSPELPESWVWASLSLVGEVRLGRQRSPKRAQGPHMRPYLRAANVTWHGLDLSDVKEMDFSPNEYETFRLHRGDVLLAEASGSADEVGKPAIWDAQIEDCCFQNTLIRVRVFREVVPYLYYHLLSDARSGALGRAARGVGIHHIGAQRTESWVIALPPIAEQRRIVAEVERRLSVIQQAEATVEANLVRAERLRQSILKQAFSGRLVPRDPSDEPATVLLERIQLEREASHADAKASRQLRPRRVKPISARQLMPREGNP